LGSVVHIAVGEGRGDDLACPGIEADVQLLPRPSYVGAVPLDQPLARAAQLQMRYGASFESRMFPV
jgi:hypothetical protein